MSELSDFCEAQKLTAVVKYGAPHNENFPDSNSWTITLKYKNRRMTVPFYTGYAFATDPTSADVLSCLLMDATSIDNYGTFEDWCSDFGYDTDSRKVEKIYKDCEKTNKKLHKFLGEDFDLFVEKEH